MKNKLFIFMILSLMIVSVSAVCAEDTTSLNLNETDTATTNSVSCQNNEVELVENTVSENDMNFNMSNANEITNEPNTGDTIYVNPINGDDKNTGVDWDNSVKTINKALTLVNDNGVIYLAEGEHTTPVRINKNVKLIGQNQEKTILTNSNNCFLTITSNGNNVGIYNITFRNNKQAIQINGKDGNKYYINNCSFINNTAANDGGAIYIKYGDLTINNSNFMNNSAYHGGAVSVFYGTLIMDNSTFINNTAKNIPATRYYGGAIYTYNVNSTINNSIFINNTANAGGGAIYISYHGNSTINNSIFINNTADGSGGAIYMSSYGNSTINNSIFMNNSANAGGGAIYIGDSNITIMDSIFINNTATEYRGGVIYIYNGNSTIVNSIFINNTSLSSGGAIYSNSRGKLDVCGNWWGSNAPDWNSLIGGASAPSSFVVLDVCVNEIGSNVYNVIANLYLNGTQTIADIPTRNITFKCGSEIITGKMVNGTYNKTYVVNVGDKKDIIVSVDNEMQNITIKNQIITNMTINLSDIVYGEDGIITVILPNDINDKLTIYADNVSNEVDIINGSAKLIVSGLNAGAHNISAVFAGNNKYTSVNSTATLNVAKATPTLNIIINNIKYGEVLNITTTLIGVNNTKLNGNITLTINNKQYIIEVINGEGTLTGVELPVGSYDFHATWSGDNNYNSTMDSGSFNVSKMDSSILAENIIMFYHNGTRLMAVLTDYAGNSIANATIYFTVNGVTYNRTTNATGCASIALNLISGVYKVVMLYNGSDVYNGVSENVNVTIKSTIDACDVVKFYQNGTQFYAAFIDSEGNVLANTNVTFNINGVFYTRVTDEMGTAKLNINLRPGYYILTAFNSNSTEQKGFNIIVRSLIEACDLTKYFQNASNFEAIIYNKDGSIAANQTVTFNINGVFYNKVTDENGIAKLNINLRPGKYIITTYYEGLAIGNNVEVLPTLITSDLNMNYKDGSKFNATVLDGRGNPLVNQKVTFNVNGVFYYKTTNLDGIASLNINLMQGKYIITSEWDGYQTGNNIIIA